MAEQTDIARLNLLIDSSQANRATGDLARLEGSAGRAERATSDLSRSSSTLNRGLGAMVGSVSRLIPLLATLSGGLLSTAGIGRSIGLAFEFEATAAALRGLTGDLQTTQFLLERARESAQGGPIRVTEMREAAITMLRMGLNANQTAIALDVVADHVARIGGGRGEFQAIADALGLMAQRGRISTRELLGLTRAGLPAFEILTRALGVTNDELERMVERRELDPGFAARTILLEALERAEANAEAPHIKDLAKDLRDEFLLLGETIGQAFVLPEGLTTMIRSVRDFRELVNSTRQALRDMDPDTKEMVLALRDFLLIVVGLPLALTTLNLALRITSRLLIIMTGATTGAAGAMRLLRGAVVALAGIAVGDLIREFGIVSEAVERIGTGFSMLERRISLFRGKISEQQYLRDIVDLGTAMEDNLRQIRDLGERADVLGRIGRQTPDDMNSILRMLETMQRVYGDIVEQLDTLGDGGGDVVDMANQIRQAFQDMGVDAAKAGKDTEDALAGVLGMIRALQLEQRLIGVLPDSRARASQLIQFETELLKLPTDDLEQVIALLKQAPTEPLRLLREEDPERARTVAEALELVNEKLRELEDAEAFNQFIKNFSSAFGDLIGDIIFDFDNLEATIENFIRSISRMVFDLIVARQIARSIESAFFPGPGFPGAAKGAIMSGGNIRMMQMGGVLKQPTFIPQGVIAGEAGEEAIMPLRRLPSGRLGVESAGGGSGGVTVVGPLVQVQARDLAGFRETVPQLGRDVSRALRRVR